MHSVDKGLSYTEGYTAQQLNSLNIIKKEKLLMKLFRTSDYITSDKSNEYAIDIITTSLQDINDNILDVTSVSIYGARDAYNLVPGCAENDMQKFIDDHNKIDLLDCYISILHIVETWPYSD